MLGNIFPPFTTMQECNLDWILTKVKNILRFVPDDGQVGQILRRTRSGAEWSDEQGGGGAVNSVNGQTGTVVLTAADVGALPDSTPIPTNTSDLNNDSGFVDAAGAAAAAPVQSVNGQTGAVTLSIPTNTSDLNNDSGYITAGQAPVQSVNGQTGTVTLSIPTNTSDLNNDSGFVDAAGAAAAAPVQSVNGQTGAVTVGSRIDTLYASGTYAGSFTLAHSIADYDLILVYAGNGSYYFSQLVYSQASVGMVASTEGVYVHFLLSGTSGTIIANTNGFFVSSVYGIKLTS